MERAFAAAGTWAASFAALCTVAPAIERKRTRNGYHAAQKSSVRLGISSPNQPLTAPEVKPLYICLWHVINTINAGSRDIITPAQIKLYLLPNGPTKV